MDKQLNTALGVLKDAYPIEKATRGIRFAKTSTPGWTLKDGVVEYGDLRDAMRALGTLISGVKCEGEAVPFKTLGIMLDCSRNAVMTVDHLKEWLRQLALMGYNQVLLYTEDTYAIDGEEWFGYLRGRYTHAELRAIDAYAARLGIEIVGCIQTLGHLAQILKHGHYGNVRDTGDILLVGEEKTYELIEKMIATWAKCVKSRRIHIGMDEAHMLGRGRYMDLHGWRRNFDIFNEHIARVLKICEKYEMRPMIWSDMYFRMGSKTGNYYDLEAQIPKDAVKAIPKGVELVYWDYYHNETETFKKFIELHRELGSEPIMGSGVWTWGMPWYSPCHSADTVVPCVEACKTTGLQEVFFTLWGDDGAYCDFDSVLAGLLHAAEQAYGVSDPAILGKKLAAISNADYAQQSLPSALGIPGATAEILWDDPVIAANIRRHSRKWGGWWYQKWPKDLDGFAKALEDQAAGLKAQSKLRGGGDIAHAKRLCEFIAAKIRLEVAVRAAYAKKDKRTLRKLIAESDRVGALCRKLIPSFRQVWFKKNKPFGWEHLHFRLAGQAARFAELSQRLEDFTSGAVDTLPEFDEKTPKN